MKTLKDYGMKQTHIVLKEYDLGSALMSIEVNENEHVDDIWNMIISYYEKDRAEQHKDPDPEYFVINLDEPYADEIAEIIKKHTKDGEE